jgi:hypothetical protein
MKVPRQGFGRRGRSSSGPSDSHLERVREAREAGDAVADRERAQLREMRSDDWEMRLRGAALEMRRRLRPVGRGLRSFLGRIAHPITSGLLAIVRVPATGLGKLTQGSTDAGRWTAPRVRSASSSVSEFTYRWVTPVHTVAVVAVVAAAALVASQFMDYRGLGVGADLYQGSVNRVAQAPLRDLSTAGSAHLYLLVPVAIAALVMTVGTVAGRWQLGRLVGALGLLGIAVTLVIDLPKGLDEGNAGAVYASSDVELLRGFWIQLVASATLALCGFLLARYQEEAARPPAAPPRPERPWESDDPLAPQPGERPAFAPEPREQPPGAARPPWEAEA